MVKVLAYYPKCQVAAISKERVNSGDRFRCGANVDKNAPDVPYKGC